MYKKQEVCVGHDGRFLFQKGEYAFLKQTGLPLLRKTKVWLWEQKGY